MRRAMGTLASALALWLGSTSSLAQELPAGDPQQELIRLFHRIQRDLEEIDSLLAQAATGSLDGAPARADVSGVARFLRASEERGQEVVRGIDRLLELAASQQSSQSSQGQGQGQGQASPQPSAGGSPQQGGASTRERTPEQPGEADGGESQLEGQQPTRASPAPPQDPQGANPDTGQNRAAGAQQATAAGNASSAQGAERWGELPDRVRSLFTAEGSSDLPVEYRDWIDSYYKRLNRKR